MAKRLWIVAAAGALAAAFLGCQSDVTEPTGAPPPGYDDDYGKIEGIVYDGFSSFPLEGADVTWVCKCPVGATMGGDTTDSEGYYCINGEEFWEDHVGHDLEGTASKGSKSDVKEIEDFEPWHDYWVDFFLQ